MVYRGKSAGCQNCRKRHIKCDEVRPHCNACTRTGRSCPGYPDRFDVILKDYTASFKKPSRSIPSPPASSSSSSESSSPKNNPGSSKPTTSRALSTANSSALVSAWPPFIPPADLYPSMEDTVIPLWFNTFLYLPKDPHIRHGFMDVLPGLYSNAKSGSHLHLSSLAVGYFTVAAWTGQAPLLREAERCFALALPKLRKALHESAAGDFNYLLTSILPLSAYEEFMATKLWENPPKAHLRGAVALINDQKSKKQQVSVSPALKQAVQTQIINNTRGLNDRTIQTPQSWPLSQAEDRPDPRLLLSSISSEIVSLRNAWENMPSCPWNSADASVILRTATEIDVNLVSWTYCVPSHWKPVPASIIPQSVRDAGIWKNRCDCYSDIWVAHIWNTYRDCRTVVQKIMLSCLRILRWDDADGSKATAIVSTIRQLADDICGTVPFFLGDQLESVRLRSGLVTYPFSETRPITSTHVHAAPVHGAWQLFMPIRNLYNPDLELPAEQFTWIRKQMERILVIYFQR